jgi:aldehyde:ferredoxin oxidoreductase
MFFKRIFVGVNFVKEKDLAKLEVLANIKGRTLQQQVYHDRQAFMDMVRTIHADFNNDPKIKQDNRKTGTATIVKAVNAMGALPTFNFRR